MPCGHTIYYLACFRIRANLHKPYLHYLHETTCCINLKNSKDMGQFPYQSAYRKIILVYHLKSVGFIKIEFVASIPQQIGTSTMHFSNVSGGHIKICLLKCLLTLQGNALLMSQLFWNGCNEFQFLGPHIVA